MVARGEQDITPGFTLWGCDLIWKRQKDVPLRSTPGNGIMLGVVREKDLSSETVTG